MEDGETHRAMAYCSATDRNVPVLIRELPKLARHRRTHYRDAESLRCLEYGVRCTGHFCPLFDVEPLSESELTGESFSRNR